MGERRSRRAVGLLFTALAALTVLWPSFAGGGTGGPTGDEQIRAAFATAFDGSAPLDERVRSFEHPATARAALLTWPDVGLGVREDDLRARVNGVLHHGDSAEVHFEFVATGTSLGELVPFGVAVWRDGTWRVSDDTLCAVSSIVGGVCRDHPPTEEWQAYWQGTAIRGHATIPVTFADGTSVQLTLPDDATPRSAYLTSSAHLRVAGSVQTVAIVNGAAKVHTLTRYRTPHRRSADLDANGSLNLRTGGWTVRVDAANLSTDARELVARELRPRVSELGMVELEPGPHLELHGPTPDAGGSRARKGPRSSDPLAPVVQITPAEGARPFGVLYLAHTGCRATLVVPAPVVGLPSRCFDGAGVELSVEGGDPDLLARLVEESDLTVVR